MKMNIISIEPSGGGGIAHYAFCLNRALQQEGTGIHLLTSSRWVMEFDGGVHIHKIFNRTKTNPLKVYTLCRSLRRDASLVHWQSASHPKLLLWMMRLVPLKNLPWVYTVHNVLPHENAPGMIPLHEKIYAKAKGLIFHNEYSANLFSEHYPHLNPLKAVIPHGEYGFLAGDRTGCAKLPKTPAVLFFGNIRPYKGLKTLLQAFKDVSTALPDARLHIVGQPLEPFDPYSRLIGELGIADKIDLRLQYVADREIPQIFAQASIVVLPYTHIDQSGVLLLSLALGKAVVASNVGGIPEVITDGKSGVLVEPDNPVQLAQRMIELLKSPERIESIGRIAAQDVHDRFSWSKIASQTLEFYGKVLDELG